MTDTMQVRRQAEEFRSEIARLPEPTRSSLPPKEAGERYNNLWRDVLRARLEFCWRMPEKARISAAATGNICTFTLWSRLDALLARLIDLLDY